MSELDFNNHSDLTQSVFGEYPRKRFYRNIHIHRYFTAVPTVVTAVPKVVVNDGNSNVLTKA